MKTHARILAVGLVLVSVFLAGGCLEAASRGVLDGMSSAVSALIEDLIAEFFAPLTGGG